MGCGVQSKIDTCQLSISHATPLWIESRLIDSATGKDKQYDRVKFVNGYGKHRPSFTVSFKGYKLEANGVHKKYSNGLEVDSRGSPTYTIFLGDDILDES